MKRNKKGNEITERKSKKINILIFPAFEKNSTSRKRSGML